MTARDPVAAPYRPAPPSRLELIRWPDDFGTRFVVTVDTEEEFDWSAPLSRQERKVSAIAGLADGHRRFAERGVALCYLVDHPVASDPAAIDTLKAVLADGRSTIGTQLHPWVNPPNDEEVSPVNSFPGNLSRALEAAKIDVLTDAIQRAFGVAPKVYRSGRYGIGPRTLELLATQGYRLDSSIRARYDYSADGGPDFRGVGAAAFRRDGMIELPLTTVFIGLARRGGVALHDAIAKVPRGRGLFARARLLSRVALTPEDMPVADALEAVRIALDEGVGVLNFAFHSPSLVPGHTPYVRDAADLARFHSWWGQVLDLLDRRGARPVSTDALIAAADAAGSALASGSAAPLTPQRRAGL